ncbi:helix-turn-helix domain-containing protein [Pseudomonas tohonis]|uniref:helix-turn-helix domain-containing protein n=1 Tax=Pseudomonas tohonis TaxID=2725477 RepID=UPI0021D9A5EE|nr:helix-turn-helix transcriptional regulator [Pseudomonas tohonis]UXY55410.1 helix-turn-helix domain-containing protein [Pseudomonas tohonis]
MSNEEIARQIKDDVEIYGPTWRSAFSFDVRRVMQEKGLKNVDVAERLNVSEANISRMLNGEQNLKIETMYMLAAAVDESLCIYLGDRHSEKSNNNDLYVFDVEFNAYRGKWTSRQSDCWSSRYIECANEVMEEADESAFAFG